MNPYFTVNDSEHFTFYRIPKLLFTDEIYQTVSTDAKMLYGLLLDRLSLSEKNDWKDDGVRKTCHAIRQYQHALNYSEAWMTEYVYNIVLLAKKEPKPKA